MVSLKRRQAAIKNRLQEAIDIALNSGYTVYSSGTTYFHYSDGKRIGYVEIDNLTFGYNLNKIMTPCGHNGSSSSFMREVQDLNAEILKKCLGSHNTDLYTTVRDLNGATKDLVPKYYDDAESWFNRYWNKDNTEVFTPKTVF